MSTPLYQTLALTLDAYHRCLESGNEWADKHRERIEALVSEHMPSGSGFDAGTRLDLDSPAGLLVFTTAFHHMDEVGSYDGWTEHAVKVRASLMFGIRLDVTGQNRNEVKDYIAEMFSEALCAEVGL